MNKNHTYPATHKLVVIACIPCRLPTAGRGGGTAAAVRAVELGFRRMEVFFLMTGGDLAARGEVAELDSPEGRLAMSRIFARGLWRPVCSPAAVPASTLVRVVLLHAPREAPSVVSCPVFIACLAPPTPPRSAADCIAGE